MTAPIEKHLFVSNFSQISVYNEANNSLVTSLYETTQASCAQAFFTSGVLSPDGTTLYLAQQSNNGSFANSQIVTFNTQTNTFGAAISSSHGLFLRDLMFASDGKTIYGLTPDGIVTYNTASHQFSDLTAIPRSYGMARDSNTGNFYVVAATPDYQHTVLDVVNSVGSIVATHEFTPPIESQGIQIDPGNGRLYLEGAGTGILDINETTGAVIDTISPPGSSGFDADTVPPLLANTLNGELYSTTLQNNALVAAYTMSNDNLLRATPTSGGAFAAAMSLSQDGQRLYVQNGSTINVISTSSDTVTSTFTLTSPAKFNTPYAFIFAE